MKSVVSVLFLALGIHSVGGVKLRGSELINLLDGNSLLSGSYTGSTTVLGETITGHIVIDSDTEADLSLSGPVSLSCADEAYTLDGSTITLDNVDEDGDCVHDALDEYDVTLESITYDATNDVITIEVKYLVMKISIVMTQDTIIKFQDLAALMIARSHLGASPDGVYKGSKTVLGVSITAEMDFADDGNQVDLKISGPITLECDDEPYTLATDGSTLTLDNASKSGDCVHDDLKEENVDLESISYDSSSDAIAIKVKYSVITVTVDLDHQSSSSPSRRYK
uniref:Lipid-binding serum glycoprotein N-terminal domain-containing protein n=1 Tax=Aureoumbra lagunensis TaxID=44058 RepID=A0A7S3JTE8_9STRA|mmetsp:Transcript_4368/g.6194  ORF Transcript_4368/g.6194 Transcript_4368/m.6194 type:complete len:281 (-) Transcript_4368:1166-2008(-)|eukprot:CAMPEP_0197289382 /NCGR_PEP_ID=MMETSP0890-20130614/6622_1 /TAXON_ID=44058 ORGANISM="Aureoumbra lagunensis, Strain CCMP1510" /NCGR_SAMPLE_ID=MMETSP0890 /ASSEMBLY_ACC=CAM_ASM_000533 /LENGTH=280 /DNA_ID=CAMNT_0042760751 /DNA_START=49 /DNA_END=891 /DNA_ORIENTATION=-